MIDSTTSTASQLSSPATAAAVTAAGKSNALTSDFDTFLKMLTVQARYQDPLEPIDSTEYAAQLAQFSMVEQQVQTNDALSALIAQMSGSNFSSLASWVGMEARAVTPVTFTGDPVEISPNPAALADEVFLVVRDSLGTQVQKLPIPVSTDPIVWTGTDSTGAPMLNDTYSFSVESYSEGEKILDEPAAVYGRVNEAQIVGGEVVLILDGGQAILSSSVTALRQGVPLA